MTTDFLTWWIPLVIVMLGAIAAFEFRARIWEVARQSWRAIDDELRWRTIMFGGAAMAGIGKLYRTRDWDIRDMWLYRNLFRDDQLFFFGLALTLVAAYFWIGAIRRGRT